MVDASYPELRLERESATQFVLAGVFADQQFRVSLGGSLGPDWDPVLASRLFAENMTTATLFGERVAAELDSGFVPAFMTAWLTVQARNAAEGINSSTRDAITGLDDPSPVFEALLLRGAAEYARTIVGTVSNFGAHDAAVAAGAKAKTWVSSGSPRHASMDGQTVPLAQNFSNGMAWPGDPSGGAGQVANCRCSVRFD